MTRQLFRQTLLCLFLWTALPLLASDDHGHEDQNAAPDHHEHEEGEEAHGEGRATISPARAAAAGIETAAAGPAKLHQRLMLHGRIAPNSGGRVEVAAPFAGIVQSVAVHEGATVAQGDTLATVRNSDSLQTYTVKAPAAGVIIERHVSPGTAVGEEPLLTLLNQDQVWAIVSAFPSDLDQLAPGQPAQIAAVFGQRTIEAAVDYIAPTTTQGQATPVRFVIDNAEGVWRPGQAVSAAITVVSIDIPLAVTADAIQTIEEKPVVFVREGDAFEVREIRLGRSDGEMVEVLSGLQPGEEYVIENSFLVKADILKSGASHAH